MKCPVCGNSAEGTFRDRPAATARGSAAPGYRVLECQACRSCFSDPMKAAPEASYAGGEFYNWRRKFDWFLGDLRLVRRGGRLLELGCGEGALLGALRGVDACGVDMNGEAVRLARSRGLDVFHAPAGEFLRAHFSPGFSVVAAFHFLEHSEDPAGLLRLIGAALEKNGRLFLSVPNPGRVMFLEELREDWDFPPHHLVRFSERGLLELLSACGFRVLKVRRMPWDPVYSAGRLAGFLDHFGRGSFGLDIPSLPRLRRNILRASLLVPLALSRPGALAGNFFRGGQSMYIAAEKQEGNAP